MSERDGLEKGRRNFSDLPWIGLDGPVVVPPARPESDQPVETRVVFDKTPVNESPVPSPTRRERIIAVLGDIPFMRMRRYPRA